MNRRTCVLWLGIVAASPLTAGAADFYPIASISTSTSETDLWPASNLIQGPVVGFDANEPHDKTSGGSDGNWVTDACGFPCDYYDSFAPPVLALDLGQDQPLTQIDVWGYSSANANGASAFSLRFATEADGPDGFGTSIAFQPSYSGLPNDETTRMTFPFAQSVNARYVELTVDDNFFMPPGDGSAGETPGGDRVGLGEIAFSIIPEPATIGMVWIMLLATLLVRTFRN